MLQLLLEHGAKLEVKSSGGETALLLAALYGRNAVVEELIKRGAAIEATNRDRETALHLASKGGRRGVMRILLRNGANAKAKDGKKMTALQIFRDNEDVLESRGEDATIIGILTAGQ